MKTNFFTWFGVCFLVFSSCSNETFLQEKVNNPYEVDFGDTKFTESSLSVKQALNNLNFVYRNNDFQKQRRVRKIELLKSSDLKLYTRSEFAEDSPMAYVVNYENEAGYAILGADINMPPIIVLGDEGNFSTTNYLNFLQDNYTRAKTDDVDLSDPQDMQYVLVTNGLTSPTMGQFTPIANPRDTVMLAKIWPLVKTKWAQGYPYNYYTVNEANVTCPAGCVPVAVAQILMSLTYHKNKLDWPDIEGSSGDVYEIDWKKILRASLDTVKYSSLTPSSMEVAYLLKGVGDNLNASYTPSGTPASSFAAKNLLMEMGLIQTALIPSFSTDDAYDMIVSKRLPMYLEAWHEGETPQDRSGHAFVLDGWLQLGYTVDSSIIQNPFIEPTPEQRMFNLVHCNFGWGGLCDGYYTPGSFKLSESEFDSYQEENDNSTIPSTYEYVLNLKEIVYNF